MYRMTRRIPAPALVVAALAFAPAAGTHEPAPAASAPPRGELLRATLPAGDFRNVRVAIVELPPGTGAPRHRHDVAIVAHVLEGSVENRFNGGEVQVHSQGEAWWEAPGTIHDLARNPSETVTARLLLVYIGEDGKAPTVRLD